MNSQAINHNSQTIFSILNQAQQQDSQLREDIAELNTSAKLHADSQGILGQVIDLFV